MAKLILVRHGESEWNAKNLWTGLTNIGLSEKGRKQARVIGEKTKYLLIDIAFTSALSRAKQTLEEIKKASGANFPAVETSALNERDYGIFTGKNKWEIKKELGDSEFQKLRRAWDSPIPNGESLKDVYNRTIPYYQAEILPKLKEGKNVIIVAHGNSLRALTKYLENISDEDISNLEIEIGEVDIFEINHGGSVSSKKILK